MENVSFCILFSLSLEKQIIKSEILAWKMSAFTFSSLSGKANHKIWNTSMENVSFYILFSLSLKKQIM